MQIDKKLLRKIDKELQSLYNRIGLDRKTLNEVFDKSTLLTFSKLISDGVIKYVDFIISTGKEANVFLGFTPDNSPVAIKVYRTSTSNFNKMRYYIQGDPRFKALGKNRREITYQWVKKEYKNLDILSKLSIPSPKPLKALQNILVMEYIGNQNYPAPLLKDTTLPDPKSICDSIIDYMERMYKKGNLVHGDMSEYNILLHEDIPYLIDLAQGVMLDHPMAIDFLRRDINNVINFFRRYDIMLDVEETFNRITKKV